MRQRLGRVTGVVVLAVCLQGRPSQGQQPQTTQPAAKLERAPTQAPAPAPLLEIYQIDIDPSGTGFALGKPRLEGDVYVLTAWPDKAIIRVPVAKIKQITQRTKDLNKEVVYRIDLVPTGRMIARAQPKMQGGTYVFTSWRDNTLMSLRGSDVQKVTKVTGMAAFRIQQEELGAALIGNLPMQGGGTVTVIPGQGPAGITPAGQAPPPGTNWIYQGVPGVTDAYAPANATVASPGDVPRAPEPVPTRAPGQ